MDIPAKYAALAFYLFVLSATASDTTPELGIRDHTPKRTAFINARLVISPDRTIDSGTLLIEDGVIRNVGKTVSLPEGTVVVDLGGRSVYPGFIDPYSDYGIPENEQPSSRQGRGPKYEAERAGGNAWNEAIHAESDWAKSFLPDSAAADEYLHNGFTIVQTARLDGIFRGRSTVVLLGAGLPNDQMLRPYSHQFASFNKGSSSQDYPSSLMGAISLIRQAFLDVSWYRSAHAAWQADPAQKMPEFNSAIGALSESNDDTILFATQDEHELLRANSIAQEFGKTFIYLGSGYEYRRSAEIARTGAVVILPLALPEPPEVSTFEDELDVTLAELRHWERAPGNAAALDNEGISFAFTSHGLKKQDFLINLRKAIRHGLTEKTALEALTSFPARLCGVDRYAGTLEPGKLANFIVCNGDVFADSTKVMAAWVAGSKYEFQPLDAVDFRGTYALKAAADSALLSLRGTVSELEGYLMSGGDSATITNVKVDRDRLSFTVRGPLQKTGKHRFSARKYDRTLSGTVAGPDGRWVDWSAELVSPFVAEDDTSAAESSSVEQFISRTTFPNRAFGLEVVPKPQDLLIRNAVIWTCDKDGTLEQTDLLIRNGKFAALGKNLKTPAGAQVFDAAGKHVTPGIIDEHSHIAIAGDVNEGTHAITAEVRIGDVVDPDDLNIYRELAGGVTVSRILHGSANPIGGQAAVIKHRWGLPADSLVMSGVPRAIKFALGENVKQSGWGERYSIRYPQTRLGVDAIIRDAFQTANDYRRRWAQYDRLRDNDRRRTIPPRKDLLLDALVDILEGRMAIHCHAYVGPEMLMMLRLAQDFDLKIQSFAHGLEGYKVAPELAQAGVGVGSIPDWWAYKFETYDGIPQSPALMTEKGVLVAINSDSPELARHLNQEAAKSIMYGSMSPQEALKMVTINPAKLMGIGDRVGSIRVGKDADFVIWDDNPLSVYARVEQTWVDGRKFFDIADDSVSRELLRTEKQQLIQKVLETERSSKRHRDQDRKPYPAPEETGYYYEGGNHEIR